MCLSDTVMVDREEYLLAWLEEFLKNRDLVHKRIARMERSGKELHVERKDGTCIVYIPAPVLDVRDLAKAARHHPVGIVTFNTSANVAFLKRRWEAVVDLGRHTQVIFINPVSAQETRWIIFPATQAMLTKGKTLLAGIDAIRATVDEIAEKDIEKLVNYHG